MLWFHWTQSLTYTNTHILFGSNTGKKEGKFQRITKEWKWKLFLLKEIIIIEDKSIKKKRWKIEMEKTDGIVVARYERWYIRWLSFDFEWYICIIISWLLITSMMHSSRIIRLVPGAPIYSFASIHFVHLFLLFYLQYSLDLWPHLPFLRSGANWLLFKATFLRLYTFVYAFEIVLVWLRACQFIITGKLLINSMIFGDLSFRPVCWHRTDMAVVVVVVCCPSKYSRFFCYFLFHFFSICLSGHTHTIGQNLFAMTISTEYELFVLNIKKK